LLAQDVARLREQVGCLRQRWTAFSREVAIEERGSPVAPESAPGYLPAVELDWDHFDLLSLDIFDTCIWRLCGSPEPVFTALEDWAQSEQIAGDGFSRQRKEAEERLRRDEQASGRAEDVTLEAIYGQLQAEGILSAEAARSLQAREIALERLWLRPVSAMRELAQEAHERGKGPVYISEMYLSQALLVEILRDLGFPVHEGYLFTSGEVGLSKGSGRLFQHVQTCFPGARFLHLGDNATSDGECAERAGWQSRVVPASSSWLRADPLSHLVAGLCQDLPCEAGGFWKRMGATLVGPVVACWMTSLLREVRGGAVRHLGFLTRDGYFPQRVFERLGPLVAPELEGSTVYASRRLWGLAAMDTIQPQDWDFLLKPAPGMRTGDFFERAGIRPAVYEPLCRGAGLDPGARLCHHRGFHEATDKDRLYHLFIQCMEGFYGLRDGLRERVLGYLAAHPAISQTGLILDIGWNGSSLQHLHRLVGERCPEGRYLGLWQEAPARNLAGISARSWLTEGEGAIEAETLLRGGVALVEWLFGSPLGTVADLQFEGGCWHPVYAAGQTPSAVDVQIYQQIEDGLDCFIEAFTAAEGCCVAGDGRVFARQALARLLFQPTAEERANLGALSHREGWAGGRPMRLLPRGMTDADEETRRLAFCYAGWKGGWDWDNWLEG
jgi:FMN phosphatase YigB (HAD superfamily)